MKFNPTWIRSGEYNVVISEGGVTVLTNPGQYTPRNIQLPNDVSKATSDELQSIADQAVIEWKEFCQESPEVSEFLFGEP